MIGKVEGHREDEGRKDWHGHVSAITVDPKARRQGLAKWMMHYLEQVADKLHRAWYVDLFVRASNRVAINMYSALGYHIYRTVTKYYSGERDEDAYDMRKSLSRDNTGETSKPTGIKIPPEKL